MGENLEYSSIPMRTPDLVAASVAGIQERYGQKYVSPELYLGTEVTVDGRAEPDLGLARGVTPSAVLVRRQMEIEKGHWPGMGEVLVGRMAAAKLGIAEDELRIGDELRFEGRRWRISGVFSAGGSAFESEVWCRLDELQQAMKRQDLSLVAVALAPEGDFADLDLFCKERLDLELQAIREVDYYATLQQHYRPVRMVAWLVVALVSGAGVFAGMNTMYGAVVGRVRELSTLRTLGFARRAILLSLIQESVVLSAAAVLLASTAALWVVTGRAVRFTMGAFELHIDGPAVLLGCSVGMLLGVAGAIPPAIRAFRRPISEGLKAI